MAFWRKDPSRGRAFPRCSAVIVAAGTASRMEGIDKILTPLGGEPLLLHTLAPFQASEQVEEIVIVTREFLVTGIRQLAAAQGYVMAADKSGKWKTGFQLAFCIDGLMLVAYGPHLPEPFPTLLFGETGFWLRNALLWLSLLLTIWSGLHYCIQGSKFIRG